MSTGPRECNGNPHDHVLMCPRQATAIAGLAVMAGMARRDDGIGLAWWKLGLNQLRYADAETAMEDLVSGGIGERSWITARDVIRRVRAIRAARHEKAPPPVPPAGLEWRDEQRFIRWYWTAVGNGEEAPRALELAAGGIGADRYLPPAPPDTGEPVDPVTAERVRAVIEKSRRDESRGANRSDRL